ncbi:TPR-like protein [Pyrenochaeta sp. DS3sAY3a]|nr:TPR-like protein [Pyrenochaeta sp. DS3sAY3a]
MSISSLSGWATAFALIVGALLLLRLRFHFARPSPVHPAATTQRLGLHKVTPDQPHGTIDIIAVHGLGTESPRTWEYNLKEGGTVNWLADSNMLSEIIPEATIYTYDWDADYLKNAAIQTLRSRSDDLLACIMREREREGGPRSSNRPIIFIASCFGGLLIAEAINRAATEGSVHRQLLFSTVGIAFLGTPFKGSDGDQQAQWQVFVGGIMGQRTSPQLVEDLNKSDKELKSIVESFAETARAESLQLDLCCFYETKETQVLRRFLGNLLGSQAAAVISKHIVYKLLVTKSSACLDGFRSLALNTTHSGMNKFDGPTNHHFGLVSHVLRGFVDKASSVLEKRMKSSWARYWIVPFGRNEDFVGRRSVLDWLVKELLPDSNPDDCQRVAIVGLGGIGKSQIALEAVYRIRDRDPTCSLFWVSAVDVTSFEKAYREIGQELKVDGIGDEKADVKTLVKEALSHDRAGKWLLIIDNADDMEVLYGTPGIGDSTPGTSLAKYLPFSHKGSILFTSRSRKVAVDLVQSENHIISIEDMSRDESIELLKTYVKDDLISDTESTAKLLDILANLPLAIRQAGAFMAKHQVSTKEYLATCESCEQDLVELLSEDYQDRYRYDNSQNAVAKTWLISFRDIQKYDPVAADYLKFMCFLADKDIPLSLLPEKGRIKAMKAIGSLKAYGFITQRIEPNSYDIHRLVLTSMLNWLESQGLRAKWAIVVLQRLADVYPFPTHENRNIWLKYQPHAQHFTKKTADVNDGRTMGSLRFKLGVSLDRTGNYREAELMLREALVLQDKALDKQHADVLTTMNYLATVLDNEGQYVEAEEKHRQTLKLREERLGKEDPDTLISMNDLANVLRHQGKYADAETINRETLELRKKVLGNKDPATIMSMNRLGLVLNHLGKNEEAEKLQRETLKLREEVLGHAHPDTLMSMNNLANTLDDLEEYEEAEEIHQEVLILRERVLGKEHPETILGMNNLGAVLCTREKYEEAEQKSRQALELSESVLGKEHPTTFMCMNNLANALDGQGKHEEEEHIRQEEYQLSAKVLGKEHPETISSLGNIVTMLFEQERYEEAMLKSREIFELRTRELGKEHPDTLTSLRDIGVALHELERYEEATQIFQETFELRKKALGKEHLDTLTSISDIGEALHELERYEEAIERFQETFELRKKVLGKEHPDTLTSLSDIGEALYELERYEEATQIFQETFELRKTVLGEEHPDTIKSKENLEQCGQARD